MPEWSPSRREFLGVAGVGGSSAAGSPVASWGNVTDAVPDHPFVPTADERWSVDLGDAAYLIGPVDGTFYARTSGVVHAIATDGTHRWRFEAESEYPGVQVGRSSPYGGSARIVYVDDDDRVYALDPEDGSEHWRYEEAWRPSVAATIPGLVVVFDDERVGHEDALVGLSANDGSERWRVALDGGMWLSPHYDGETFYAGTTEGTLYAVDPEAGELRWKVERSGEGGDSEDEPPHLVATDSTDDLAFAWASEAGTLYAFETHDGTERWRLDADSDAYDFPGTVQDGTAYLREGSSLRALFAADGTERWRFDAEAFLSWPKVVGDALYVGNENGLWALSAETGRERWRSGTGFIPAGVADGTLVVTDTEYSAYGLSTDDGRVRWQYDPGETLTRPPLVREDTIYLVTESGTVAVVSEPGPTPVSDALRTLVSPAGLAVGGLLGGALAVGAYRRRSATAGAGDADATEPTGVEGEPTTAEDFELVGTLAEADHAEVHEARAPDGTRVALKRLREDELAPEVFEEAVETWADLDVPGVLDVREWGLDPVPWVATEYATGGDLGAKAEHLTVEERVRVVAEAAETVHRAHREGVTHGRLVPENVLFSVDGVRVGDWRLATGLRDPPEGYRPPESGSDSGNAHPEAADVYQLAAMADDLLWGEQRTGEPDSELDDVLSRAFADDPTDRYDSALKFADALRWAVRE